MISLKTFPLALLSLILAAAMMPDAIAQTNASSATSAPATPASFDSLRFFGRWDMRTPGRALTVNSGNYVLAQFSGTSIDAHFDVSLNKPPLPTLTWRIDGGTWQESEIAPDLKLADGLAAGPHTLMLMVRGIDEHQNRWTDPLVASVTFTGLTLSDGGKLLPPLAEWDHPKLTIEFLGDSITEGVLVQGPRPGKTSWPWQSDARDSYSALTAMKLGAQWRQVGFGATGIQHGGSGGAPGAIHAFNFFHEGCPRDDWQPDLVVINQGTNDAKTRTDQFAPFYAQYLVMIRKAYPHAKIAVLRPFCGAQEATIKQQVDAARAAGDTQVYYIDTTGWYPPTAGPLHPGGAGSVKISDLLVAALKAQVLAPAATNP